MQLPANNEIIPLKRLFEAASERSNVQAQVGVIFPCACVPNEARRRHLSQRIRCSVCAFRLIREIFLASVDVHVMAVAGERERRCEHFLTRSRASPTAFSKLCVASVEVHTGGRVDSCASSPTRCAAVVRHMSGMR